MNIHELTFPKIQSLFKRCMDNGPDKNKLIYGDWSTQEIDDLKDATWEATEKLDGTNCRISWDGSVWRIGGRTKDAQFSADLANRLIKIAQGICWSDVPPDTVVFGEGVGPKIQKCGSKYCDSVDFIPFCAVVGGVWASRYSLRNFCEFNGLNIAPSLGRMTIDEAIDLASGGFDSRIGNLEAEGVVLKIYKSVDEVPLFVKVKTVDFRRGMVKK